MIVYHHEYLNYDEIDDDKEVTQWLCAHDNVDERHDAMMTTMMTMMMIMFSRNNYRSSDKPGTQRGFEAQITICDLLHHQ